MADDPIGADARLTVPEHVLARKAAGETVILNLDNEQYYGLDGVGARLWEMVERGTTVREAATALVEDYDVGQDVLVADLTSLVVDLRKNGLVVVDAS